MKSLEVGFRNSSENAAGLGDGAETDGHSLSVVDLKHFAALASAFICISSIIVAHQSHISVFFWLSERRARDAVPCIKLEPNTLSQLPCSFMHYVSTFDTV